MKQTLFVDTNYLCALHNKHDSLHDKAKKVSQLLEEFHLALSNFVLLETYTILSQRVSKQFAVEFKKTEITQNFYSIIWINKQLEENIWRIFASIKDKNFSYVDASTLALLEKEKIENLLSFDVGFAKFQKTLGFKLIGA